jgi:hypothetical protein
VPVGRKVFEHGPGCVIVNKYAHHRLPFGEAGGSFGEAGFEKVQLVAVGLVRLREVSLVIWFGAEHCDLRFGHRITVAPSLMIDDVYDIDLELVLSRVSSLMDPHPKLSNAV